jgi:hypothetical protein
MCRRLKQTTLISIAGLFYHENNQEAIVLMFEAEAVEGGILLLRLP